MSSLSGNKQRIVRKQGTIMRVSSYLLKHKGLFILTLSLAMGMTACLIAVPYAIKIILEHLREVAELSALWMGVAVIAVLYLGSQLFNCARIRVNNTLEQQVLLEMRRDLHAKLLRLPVSFYDQRKSGDISSRVIEDVATLERALLDGTEQGTQAVLTIIGITAVLFIMNPTLAWLVFLPVPILLVVAHFYSRRSRKVWRKVREAAGDLNSLLVEDIQGNRLIQTFGLAARESARFENKASVLRDLTLRAMFRWSLYSPGTTFVTNLGMVAIVGYGGFRILNGNADFPMEMLIAFFLYGTMLYQPIGMLHGLNHMIAAGRASGDRVFEILDAEVAVDDPLQPVPLPQGPISIIFKNVSFKYPERPAVLEEFNFVCEPNKVTALVGHTGAGKSTIANLAMRTYDVTAGSLLINGVDIRSVSLQSLHDTIGYVAQDPFLFEGSVRDNLLLASPSANETELRQALQGASAWEFVERLPFGLDTNIGEKGIRLSQGEKQRITIARVLLKNPPFVILDEATASVDTITERKIQEALDLLVRQRTVLIIAHRLSTVRRADNIIVLDQGRIIEQGNHDDLLIADGHYANLWRHQQDLIDGQVWV
jgi:ATP-binding cassette subfamily B protein